ncbi:hypothetical protein STAL104432_23680 [Streptomyces albus]
MPTATPRASSSRTHAWRTGRSWARAADRAVPPSPGIEKRVSTVTAPPVRPTTTKPNWGSRGGRTRRSACRAIRAGGSPLAAAVRTQSSAKAPGSASSSSRPSRAPAGRPMARAGSTAACRASPGAPPQPTAGNQPSRTAKTVASTAASRNSGRAASTAPRAPARAVGGLCPGPRAPARRVRAPSAAATRRATAREAAISVRETPRADSTSGRTGWPETQEVPKSPRSSPKAQSPSRCRGPASSPVSRRMAARVPGVGSRSA